MNSFDINTHKTHLTNILVDIYKDSHLANLLGFKGGTAAMYFYKLPRFSVDLDFDLTIKFEPDSEGINKLTDKISSILSKKYIIKDQSLKFNTLFWSLSYGEGNRQIKVEISTREQPFNNYDLKDLYGVTAKVSQVRDMIAHKMIAITERKTLANRDLFDTHYFLSSQYATDINYSIVKNRLDKNPKEYYLYLLNFLKNLSNHNFLDGLGELVDQNQKNWVRNKMVKELMGLINRQIDMKLWEKITAS